MAETEWTEEVATPPKKGIPMWVWGCGGCAVVAMIGVLVAVGFGVKFWQKMTDPDVVWPNVDAVLPFDERPAGYTAYGAGFGESGGYFLYSKEREVGAMLLVVEDKSQKERDQLFSGEGFEKSSEFGVGSVRDVTPIEVTVGDHTCKAVMFKASQVKIQFGDSKNRRKDAWIVLVDLSRDDGKFRMLELFDMGAVIGREHREAGEHGQGDPGDQAAEAEEPPPQEVGQELLDTFIEPFDPWG